MGHVPPRHQHDAWASAGFLPGPLIPPERRAGHPWRIPFAGLLVLAALAFAGLGSWQVERRAWKLALIEAVDTRVHAAPVAAPGPGAPAVTAAHDAYRHVTVQGRFLHGRETLVQALTERGAGFWVLTPLRTDAGWTVLVNRGFVPQDRSSPASRPGGQAEGPVTVSGLLRITEPGGGFLRTNDPATDRWFSRDVPAIAAARHLVDPAPYFIDADAASDDSGWPLGGLTVIRFHNSHLVYALTWFGLCGLSLFGLQHVLRHGRG